MQKDIYIYKDTQSENPYKQLYQKTPINKYLI